MRNYELAGSVSQIRDAEGGAKYLRVGDVWVFLPPELARKLPERAFEEGTGLLVRGFAKRHQELSDWWVLVAAQVAVLEQPPPKFATALFVLPYAGGAGEVGQYLLRGREGETYLIEGTAPGGVREGDEVIVRGTPETPEPGRLVLKASWAVPVRQFTTLSPRKPKVEKPKPAPATTTSAPKPAEPKAAPPKEPPTAPPPREEKRRGLFGLFKKK